MMARNYSDRFSYVCIGTKLYGWAIARMVEVTGCEYLKEKENCRSDIFSANMSAKYLQRSSHGCDKRNDTPQAQTFSDLCVVLLCLLTFYVLRFKYLTRTTNKLNRFLIIQMFLLKKKKGMVQTLGQLCCVCETFSLSQMVRPTGLFFFFIVFSYRFFFFLASWVNFPDLFLLTSFLICQPISGNPNFSHFATTKYRTAQPLKSENAKQFCKLLICTSLIQNIG